MGTGERLTAADLRAVMASFRDALRLHQTAINRLNVYPVPDGDTGTNMALTLESVLAELDDAAPIGADMATVCKAISHGSLMGARGNSGVILSQVLRGISETVRECDEIDGPAFAGALAAASAAAYKAVMRPVEGTILTVARAAADAATEMTAEGDAPLIAVVDAAARAGAVALENTPELLPVLKQAGVVDAGGSGFLLLLDAVLLVADGRPLPEPAVVAPEEEGDAFPDALFAHDEHGISDLRYEVMYFLEAPDEAIDGFKDVWAGIGDSIVVVGGDGIWNCHIHTDDIGAAIEAAVDCGRPRKIRVTDLMEQVEEEKWVRAAAGDADGGDDALASTPVATAVVAVAVGDGIRRIFHSLHVQQIVTGGQTMNPSTSQLLEAVEKAPSDAVVILPNNKNIIPVAEQVDAQTTKTVRVVPTRGVAEGFASLVHYDPDAPIDENVAAMIAGAGAVVAAEVTQAVRQSMCDLGPIAEGDYLGIARDGIRALDATLAGASIALLDALVTDDHEIVTIVEGDGATAGDTRRITQWIAEARPDAVAEVHHGGQPLYPYLFGIE